MQALLPPLEVKNARDEDLDRANRSVCCRFTYDLSHSVRGTFQ